MHSTPDNFFYCVYRVAAPDKWKEGAQNTIESGGRKIKENKILSKKKQWAP